MAGWLKAIENFSLKPKYGSRRAHLALRPRHLDFHALSTRTKRLGAFCSTMPADWIRNTKLDALPSMIGISGASIST